MKIITIVILLLGAFRCSASIEIINESLSNPNSNVLFRGLYNIISIDGLSDTTGIEVLISHGSIKKEFEKYIINIQNNPEYNKLLEYRISQNILKKIYIIHQNCNDILHRHNFEEWCFHLDPQYR